ncbi:MAG: aminopeptidase P family protein [Anaerolineae bacterium]|nr:aminopeptidase P family protein [Anaerolineae bacterium]
MDKKQSEALPPEVSLPRLLRLRQVLQDRGLDGAFISQPENRRYLSGFTGSSGWLVILEKEAWLITDFRYWEQARQEAPHFELVRLVDRMDQLMTKLAERLGERRIGFESTHITVDEHQRWMAGDGPVTWVPEKNLVEPLRAVKDEGEIERIRRAAALTDEALAYGLSQVHPGMTEEDLAWVMERYMREHGAEGVAFEFIIAGGPKGALPHAHPGPDPLPTGQPIVIDMGACVDGYRSDMTRTVCLGEPEDPDTFWTVYNTVLSAQEAAIAQIRPGMSGSEADALARDVIARAGYGDAFGHSLGHGVGLAIHEAPRLGRLSEDRLEPGMVITVEPGIYLPEWGGVRIEDLAVVREDGLEILSHASKDPILSGDW